MAVVLGFSNRASTVRILLFSFDIKTMSMDKKLCPIWRGVRLNSISIPILLGGDKTYHSPPSLLHDIESLVKLKDT